MVAIGASPPLLDVTLSTLADIVRNIPSLGVPNRVRVASMVARHTSTTDHTDERGHVWLATVTWQVINGRYEPIAIEIIAPDGLPLTATALRGLPIGDLIRETRD